MFYLPLDRPATLRLMLATDCNNVDELNEFFEAPDGAGACYSTGGQFKGKLLMPVMWLLSMNDDDGKRNVNPLFVMCGDEPAIIDRSGTDVDGIPFTRTSQELIEERDRRRKDEMAKRYLLRRNAML